MGDVNDNLLSISQKLLKKISNRNLSDTNSDSGSESINTMESPEITSSQTKEQLYQHDSRFRKYVQLVEKNLQSFDAVNEWADIISFLGRLLKSFQAYPQFPIIPKKQLVAKRLAQCLNPGFPAGVHQKTLEVYAFILKTIDAQQLSEDLALWSTGLFPFVQYAATHVKPQLLLLFEQYYYPLRGKLRPAMRGFIISLLPALEEEGSEYFDRVVMLLENLSETVELPFFYSCMWLVMISNPSLRPPALNYLLRKLPKISDREAVAVVIGGKENVSLMVRAFASTLNDQQLLVQRGMLELLVQNFMLKNRMIPNEDLIILIRASFNIVLRKDMSLNRRLYSWLLGNDSQSQLQIQYFNQFGEKPATQAIRSMLLTSEQTVANQQKPYKILISLMDKWELGQPIVNNIFIDSLSSLKSSRHKEEVMQTANMWMDMMEPWSICMKLFEILDANFPHNNKKNTDKQLELVEFTLESFKLVDEEIKHVHYPLVLASLSKKLKEALKSATFIAILPQVNQCINLILILMKQLPDSVYSNRILTEEEQDIEKKKQFKPNDNILEFAREFYNLNGNTKEEEEQSDEIIENEEGGDLSSHRIKKPQPMNQQSLFDSLRGDILVEEVSNNLVEFLIDFINSYIVLPENLLSGVDVGEEGKRLKRIDHHLERILSNVCRAITTLAHHANNVQLKRQDQFTHVLLKCCQQGNVFGVVDTGLTTLTSLVQQNRFVLPTVLKQQREIKSVMDKLWGFLSPSMQLLHLRTIELLWLLVDVTLPYQIETIMSQYLIGQEEDTERLDHYEKFGIVWELSESKPKASIVFSRPMFIMLDLLREGTSPVDRRAGETWIRCHLKSYVRLLEPFIVNLLDKHILRTSVEYTVLWKYQTCLLKGGNKETEIPYFIYKRPFDTDIVDYMFTTLNTLVTFGGLNVLKSCKNHMLSEGPLADLVRYSLDTTNKSFLDILVAISIRYLETEPNKQEEEKPIRSIQLHAADLLYLIISKLDYVNMKIVQEIQTSVVHKLLFCISNGDLDIQQKLLHLLHASLAITCASSHQQTDKGHQKNSSVDSIVSTTTSLNEALVLIQTTTDIFVKCVMDALTLSSNRTMLQHWMDFVLATLPYIKNGFRFIILPILVCICDQINTRCNTMDIMIHERPEHASSSNADKELVVFLLGLEKIILFCLTDRNVNDDWFTGIKSDGIPIPNLPDNSTLNSLIQVIHQEDYKEKGRDTIIYHLPTFLHILSQVWHVFRQPDWTHQVIQTMGDAKSEAILNSFSFASDTVKKRLESIFEKLFKFSTIDFIEGFTEIFFLENPSALEWTDVSEYHWVAIDILSNTPTSTPQHIISNLLDSIRQRTPNSNRRRKIMRQGKLTDISILRLAEIYCGYIKNPESVVLLWPMIHSFSKDYLSQANTYKMFLPGLMRFLTVYLQDLSQSNEDRRIRKDAQEIYQRCIDYNILIAGKSFDQSLWMRSRTTTSMYDDTLQDDTSSIHTVDTFNDKTRQDVMITNVSQYLATTVIPNLRQLVGDNDKINSLLNNLVYYVIGPGLKSKNKHPVILDQLIEMAGMPFTYKTWRKEVWEVFIENRFFNMNTIHSQKWLKVIGTAFSIEKERMTELIARIMTTTPSTTFFSNKEQEMLNRSLNIRRLSFVLFAGTIDQYVPQLPIIQERIVELLKLEHGEMIHMEIYLLLRIILMRFSQKHLMNFWPVLITELMRLFNSFLAVDFQDRPEEAQIALAGCKFLDLLCTLELDAFQIYQWIFIRDTVETVIKPEIEGPIPIMELLDKKLAVQQSMDTFDFSETEMQPSLGSLKRPMLTMKSIVSVRQLSFFIEHVGLYVYQSSFTLSKPDLPFIESLLQNDLIKEEDGTTIDNY